MLEALHQPRFVELAQTEVYATLLTKGRGLCSVRTPRRILAENQEARERRIVAWQAKTGARNSWRTTRIRSGRGTSRSRAAR